MAQRLFYNRRDKQLWAVDCKRGFYMMIAGRRPDSLLMIGLPSHHSGVGMYSFSHYGIGLPYVYSNKIFLATSRWAITLIWCRRLISPVWAEARRTHPWISTVIQRLTTLHYTLRKSRLQLKQCAFNPPAFWPGAASDQLSSRAPRFVLAGQGSL